MTRDNCAAGKQIEGRIEPEISNEFYRAMEESYHEPIGSRKGENSGFVHCKGRLLSTRCPRSR